MKKGIYFLLLFCLFITPEYSQAKEVVNEYNLVPLPNKLTPQKGRFQLTNKVVVILPDLPEVKAITDSLIARLKIASGISLQYAKKKDSKTPSIEFNLQSGFTNEGYKLSVSPKAINIAASKANGLFYALQTIYQLMPPSVYGNECMKQENWSIPAVEIEDAPRFSYRGLMLDVARHYSPVEYIYKFIDMLAAHKMNTFHWHLTEDQGWRIEIKKYPKLIEIGSKRDETLVGYYFENYPQVFDGKEHSGYYTQQQIKDIVAYAASKYITVIPEIEMPGHALAAIASYPELSCTPDSTYKVAGTWGVFEQVYCPKEATFKFLEGVLDEVMELFPSPYIHIGGDECPKTAWVKSEHCQALIKELGLKNDSIPSLVDGRKHSKEEKLQSYFITRMEKYINSKGRNIIGWDEILEGGLAPNATVMSWRGVEGGMNAAKAGHDAIMTPGAYVYLDSYQEDPEFAPTTIGGYTTLKKTYSYNPVPGDADELVKKHVIGLQGNIWTEYMQTNERRDYQAFPRAVAIAETAWTLDKNKNWNGFCQRMAGDFQRMDVMNVKACRNFFEVNINTHVDSDNVLKVTLETYSPDAEIRYTINGKEPNINSSRYTGPFVLNGNMNLRAAAFKGEKRLGRVCSKALYGNLISGKRYVVTPQAGWMTGDVFGENDVLGANHTTLGLTNGKRGNNASYTPWTSFKMNDACNHEIVFSVDLGQMQTVSKVIFGSLFNPAFKVLPASKAMVEISSDGIEYRKVAIENFRRQLPKNGRKAYTDSLIFAPTETRYIKLTIKSGGTLRNGIDCRKDTPEEIIPADLYIDEVEVY